jgi:hypothetical protein
MTDHSHAPIDNPDRPRIIPASKTAEQMARTCLKFLEILRPGLRKKAEIAFNDSERLRWHYFPLERWERQGVSLKELNAKERNAAFNLLSSGLSRKGYQKASAIMDLETTLGELERAAGTARLVRDPKLYFFSVFGDPTGKQPWGWRAEGHHVSLHYTVVNREVISPYPSFFGANPAEVRHGPNKGLRILSAEEDLARNLLRSLGADQKRKAILNATAPADIITRDIPKVEFERVEGLAAESMTDEQRETLMNLIHEYVDRMPEEVARAEHRKLRNAGITDIHFAWAGGEASGKPHYYRLHGPFLFVEYDNTQNNANHIHSIWRHLDDDFGIDLLRYHYRNQNHHDR